MANGSVLSDRRVILASASPRRRELLTLLLSEFEVIPSGAPETASGPPASRVRHLAANKAADIARTHPDAVVIGADTLVALGGQVLGKPADARDAFRMLRLLSGRTHRVYTGVAVIADGHIHTAVEATQVKVAPLSDEEIRGYIATDEPMDKAGAYGIQGYGSKFIRAIRGDYYNVVGLPLYRLYTLLKRL